MAEIKRGDDAGIMVMGGHRGRAPSEAEKNMPAMRAILQYLATHPLAVEGADADA